MTRFGSVQFWGAVGLPERRGSGRGKKHSKSNVAVSAIWPPWMGGASMRVTDKQIHGRHARGRCVDRIVLATSACGTFRTSQLHRRMSAIGGKRKWRERGSTSVPDPKRTLAVRRLPPARKTRSIWCHRVFIPRLAVSLAVDSNRDIAADRAVPALLTDVCGDITTRRCARCAVVRV